MGITFSIDAPARIVRLTYAGEATIDEYRAAMEAIFRSVEYRPGFGFLSDRRGGPPATTAYVRATIAFDVMHKLDLAGAHWATVVSSRVNYGMSRMAAMLAETSGLSLPLEIFEDIDVAEAWLRVTSQRAPSPEDR